MSVHLCGVFCPSCNRRISLVALQGSPQFVSHNVKTGERSRCRGDFVVVPRLTGVVDLLPVEGRQAAEQLLRSETARWLAELESIVGVESVA